MQHGFGSFTDETVITNFIPEMGKKKEKDGNKYQGFRLYKKGRECNVAKLIKGFILYEKSSWFKPLFGP